MSSAAQLRSFEIPQRVLIEEGPGGLVRIAVSTPLAGAHVYLHGAHVSQFQPASSAQPLLFMSAKSHFADGKPIRGGVPVIFPWFGPRAGHPEAPAHGFARTRTWELESVECSASDIVTLVLRLEACAESLAMWPHAFTLRHRITIGSTLSMELEVENTSSETWSFEEALHTYFTVADVREVAIEGFAGCQYHDQLDAAHLEKTQAPEPIRITAETDRVYLRTQNTCLIDDPVLARRIAIEKSGSDTTVLWNPWVAKSIAMADFGDEEWPGMLCIETCNTGESSVTLAPGQKHSMRAILSETARG